MRKLFGLLAIMAALALALSVQLHAAADKAAPAIGAAAPVFSLPDQNGKTASLSDYTGKIVVLEWFNDGCPFVQRHYQSGDINATATKYAAKGVVWLSINSTDGNTNSANKDIAGKWSMNRPILNDSAGTVGHQYDAKNTPEIYIIGKDGKLAYQGGIDNDPRGELGSAKVNYAAKALDEMLAGKPVSEPITKPYGCTVHYAR